MDPHTDLNALLELAEESGIVIRSVPGAGESAEHPGGALVRLKGSEMLFLDPTAAIPDQIVVIAAALRDRPEIENRYLRPEIRELIEEGHRS